MRLGASIQPVARESDFQRKRDERKRDRADDKKKTTREEKDLAKLFRERKHKRKIR